jgi:dTDP-D-glucose 4,6-dehydratase
MYVDISKARSELNWNPRYSNEEMMVESFDWYVRNRDSILGDRSPRSLHRSPVREGVLALVSRLF